jgi:hypothetical protein
MGMGQPVQVDAEYRRIQLLDQPARDGYRISDKS